MNIFKEKYDLQTLRGIQLVVKYGIIASVLSILFTIIYDPVLNNAIPPSSYIILIPLFILGLISLYGFLLIINGRREFNIKHQKNVFTVFIIFIVVRFVLMFIGGYNQINELVKSLSPIINGLIHALVLIFFIMELTEPKTRRILWMVIPLAIIVSVINLVFLYNTFLIPYMNEMLQVIGSIPNLIILFCYYKTLIYLTNKLPVKTTPSETDSD